MATFPRPTGQFQDDDPAAGTGVVKPAATPGGTPPRSKSGFLRQPMPGTKAAGGAGVEPRRPTNVLGFPITEGVPGVTTPRAPGEASSDVNPLPVGTRAGGALRSAGAAVANAGMAGTRATVNALSYPMRAAMGFARDASRATFGMAPDANAGEPMAGIGKPPVLGRPPAINWDTPGAPPAAADAPTVAGNPKNLDPAADNISESNLAALTRLNAGGGTLSKPVGGAVAGATGKPLGAMVDGVPTFSDGSGGIARTMTDDQIKHAGDNLSRADAGALALVKGSDVLGGTPTSEQMVQQRMADVQRPITGSRPSAQAFAEADRNAALMRDPRSVAGIAARNLDMDAAYGRTPRVRRAAADQIKALTEGLSGEVAQAGKIAGDQALRQASDAAALQRTELEGANNLANTNLAGRFELAKADRQNLVGQKVVLEDGTIALMHPVSGAITRATDGEGKTVKERTEKQTSPIYTSAGGAQMLTDLTNKFLGLDPTTGMIVDKNAKGGMRAPTPAEIAKAQVAARDQLLSLQQQGGETAAAPVTASGPNGERLQLVNGQWVPAQS